LRAWRGGDSSAFDALIPLVYQDLRRLASFQMRSESPEHTLSPTGLLHESFLKLMQSSTPPDWQDRKHFYAVAARAMRQLLVDYARRKHAGKRTADPVIGAGSSGVAEAPDGDLVDLDRALTRLHEDQPRRAQMLELRHFGGLDLKEIAEVLDTSVPTVSRELRVAEAWLAHELRHGGMAHETL
jgi:RNA polymerase sigma factor (TIGR02999 family)